MDEFDLTLINAVQLRPRAPWSELAGPLRVDAATLSRRWARLTSSGTAWVTCYPGHRQVSYGCMALVEIRCAPGAVLTTADHLSRHAQAFSVEVCGGAWNILLSVGAASITAMTDYVLKRVGPAPGVLETRVHLVARAHRDASRWKLDSLDRGQRSRLTGQHAAPDGSGPISPEDRELMLALGEDGRMSIAELSTRTGLPATTVRRRLDRLLTRERAALRCDFAHLAAGWHLPALIVLDVPTHHHDHVASRLIALSETRACWTTTGAARVRLSVWTRGPEHLHQLTEQIQEQFPEIRVAETVPVLRAVKRMGRLLDADGRGIAHVPMQIWETEDEVRATTR
jgi:DNA-binding Lrp family transcriptional regulator